MFGRLRPPPSSPDCLERYPAKIIKDDPLSVYESTLLKLKQGSRLDIVHSPENENQSSSNSDISSCSDTVTQDIHGVITQCNGSNAMAIDSDSSGEYRNSKEQKKKKKNPSVLSMFYRYKTLTQDRNL